MVGVAHEVLGAELPVARHLPLLDPTQHLRAALAAVAAVEQQVQEEAHAAQVVVQRRRRGVPGGPDAAFVDGHLRHFDQAPLRPVELLVVALFERRNADQVAVQPVAPAMIGAGEGGGVAFVVAAHAHAAVAAGIQEHVQPALAVPRQDDRLLAHGRHEEVARLRHLAFVAHEQPGPGEQPLLLLAVDALVHENVATDDAAIEIDQR